MSKTRTYEYLTRDGKPVLRYGRPVTVPVPRGSVDDAGQFTENVLLSAVTRRLFGRP